jgi:hypothetical protein
VSKFLSSLISFIKIFTSSGLCNTDYYLIIFFVNLISVFRKCTRKNLTSCSNYANKPSTSCVRTACPKLSTNMVQLVNRLVARLFQQVRYSHDTIILLQPCDSNLVIIVLFYHNCIRLVGTTCVSSVL